MNVSLLNYENYILDFLEGSLSSKNQVFFLQFLQENPFIQKEIQGLLQDEYRLQASQTVDFSEKRFLKKRTAKQISLAEKQEMCFLYQQKQLSSAEEVQFKLLLKEDIALQKFFQQEMQAHALVDTHIVREKKAEFLFPLIVQKKNKTGFWIYFLFISLSWIFTGVFGFLFLKQHFFFKKETDVIQANPVIMEQVLPLAITTLPSTIQSNATTLKNKTKTKKNLSSVTQPVLEPTSETPLDLAVIEEIPVLATLEQTENNTKPSSRQYTFDFSTEKKAIKSVIGIFLFSIKKIKNDEY